MPHYAMSPLLRYSALAGAALVAVLSAAITLQASDVPAVAADVVLGEDTAGQPSSAFRRAQAQLKAWRTSMQQGYSVELAADASSAWPMEPDVLAVIHSRRAADALVRLDARCSEQGPTYRVEVLQTTVGLSPLAVHAAWVASRGGGTADPALVDQVLRHHLVEEVAGKARSVSVTPRRLGAQPRLVSFQDAADARASVLAAWPEGRLACPDHPAPALAQFAKRTGLKLSRTKAPSPMDLGLGKSLKSQPQAIPGGWRVTYAGPESLENSALYDALSIRVGTQARRVAGHYEAIDDQLKRAATWELADGELNIEWMSGPLNPGLTLSWTSR